MSVRFQPCRSAEHGFTLIELLVGLAILGLIASMLLAGIGMTGLMASRTRAEGADLDGVAAAQMVLRGDLSRLRSITQPGSSPPAIDAEGDRSFFAFVGPASDRAAPDALYRYRLTLTATGDVMLYAANILDDRAEVDEGRLTGWTPQRLLRGAATLSINYFGGDAVNGGRRWQNFWAQHAQPPDLVRVRVTFPSGDRRQWPDLVVRPRATVNGLCRIDVFSGRCEAAT